MSAQLEAQVKAIKEAQELQESKKKDVKNVDETSVLKNTDYHFIIQDGSFKKILQNLLISQLRGEVGADGGRVDTITDSTDIIADNTDPVNLKLSLSQSRINQISNAESKANANEQAIQSFGNYTSTTWQQLIDNNTKKSGNRFNIIDENPADSIIHGEITLSTSNTFLSLDANGNEMLVTIPNT